MARSVMISGPHAIGKTTTARQMAGRTGDMFVGSIAGAVAAKLKFDIDANPDPLTIIYYQNEILKGSEFLYEATALVDTVFDRSPLDLATYLTLALGDKVGFARVMVEYQNLCVELTNQHCDVLVLPEADVSESYEDKLGRPTFNLAQVDFRLKYNEVLERLVARLHPKVKVINVPVSEQYEARTIYVLQELRKLYA